MKKLFLMILCNFVLITAFSQTRIPKCFCCSDSIYSLPQPPDIYGVRDSLCICDGIKFSTVNCPGARFTWTVRDNFGNIIPVTGNGTNAITLNYTLAQQVASLATSLIIKVEIRCGDRVVTTTITATLKHIPPTNISFSLNDDGAGHYTAVANTLANWSGNGWTLKEINCPGPNPCHWVPGAIKWQGNGNTFNIPNGVLVKGKCYVLTHYVNVCTSNYIPSLCSVFNVTCFTLDGNRMKIVSKPTDKNDAQQILSEMVKEMREIK